MIWNRLSIFATIFPRGAQAASREAMRRWRRAFQTDAELRADLIRLGGVMTMTPPNPQGPSTELLAYEAGRRDFALQLLALGGVTPYEFTQLMDDSDA